MLLRQALLFLSRNREFEGFLRHHPRTLQVCRRFVPCENRNEAMERSRQLADEGYLVDLSFIGENFSSAEEIDRAENEYLALLAELERSGSTATVSLPPSQFGLRNNPDEAARRIEELVERAAETDRLVRVQMEGSDLTDDTLALIERLGSRFSNIATVLQSCLPRSTNDLDRLCRQKIPLALVKGAYQEPKGSALQKREEITLYFMRLIETLFRDGCRPAIATHDEKLIEFAIDIAFIFGLEPGDYEFQMYYGVRPELQKKLLDNGYRIRIHLPYGPDWYPYFMRRLAGAPRAVFSLFREETDQS